jgi:hypothetical protein
MLCNTGYCFFGIQYPPVYPPIGCFHPHIPLYIFVFTPGILLITISMHVIIASIILLLLFQTFLDLLMTRLRSQSAMSLTENSPTQGKSGKMPGKFLNTNDKPEATLTRDALFKLDEYNKTRPPEFAPLRKNVPTIKKLARRGGPDLRYLCVSVSELGTMLVSV